ncbi:dihydrofolate reductase [Rapidithrix thailandica]|uniref:dihydrofolate reductase n=1 Tax=Rapidithrix thailandica TaxID=413964 RepID=A0AAW9SEB8_9BACT
MKIKEQIISLITAMDERQAIGFQNELPWQLPDDQAYFEKTVRQHVTIMGRKSADSPDLLYSRFHNIILTRQNRLTLNFPGNYSLAGNLQEALEQAGKGEVFIAGGAQVYREALPLAHRLYITQVHHVFDNADAFFPLFQKEHWELYAEDFHPKDEAHAYSFTIKKLKRRSV